MNVIFISGLWNSTLRCASAEQQDQRGKGGNCGNHRLACHPQRKQTSETITPNFAPPPEKKIFTIVSFFHNQFHDKNLTPMNNHTMYNDFWMMIMMICLYRIKPSVEGL